MAGLPNHWVVVHNGSAYLVPNIPQGWLQATKLPQFSGTAARLSKHDIQIILNLLGVK
jgi:hypothetical protein